MIAHHMMPRINRSVIVISMIFAEMHTIGGRFLVLLVALQSASQLYVLVVFATKENQRLNVVILWWKEDLNVVFKNQRQLLVSKQKIIAKMNHHFLLLSLIGK
jgi:hypothetical protein